MSRVLALVVSLVLSTGLALPTHAQRVVRSDITLTGGLSSGGPVTFELHHTTGVARVQTTLGFFEPPAISAQSIAGPLQGRLPIGWSVRRVAATIVVTVSGPERLVDARVCAGSSPCPQSASLAVPQFVAGHTWTQELEHWTPPPRSRVHSEVTLSGLSTGGLVTFELHHARGVVRATIPLGFFEPPSIGAQKIANRMAPLLPRGWTLVNDGDRLLWTATGPLQPVDVRVCVGTGPCSAGASLLRPQLVAGYRWGWRPVLRGR